MKILRILLVLFSCTVNSEEMISLGGLTLDLKISDILELKGEPVKKKEQADFINLVYEYDDISVYFSGDDIVGVYTESEKICTLQNICPGSSFKEAIETYGTPNMQKRKDKILHNFHEAISFTCWYRMTEKDNFVESIEVVCQP